MIQNTEHYQADCMTIDTWGTLHDPSGTHYRHFRNGTSDISGTEGRPIGNVTAWNILVFQTLKTPVLPLNSLTFL